MIPNPMDLSTVEGNIKHGVIYSAEDFAENMRLIFQNALAYNRSPEHFVHKAALVLLEFFESRFAQAFPDDEPIFSEPIYSEPVFSEPVFSEEPIFADTEPLPVPPPPKVQRPVPQPRPQSLGSVARAGGAAAEATEVVAPVATVPVPEAPAAEPAAAAGPSTPAEERPTRKRRRTTHSALGSNFDYDFSYEEVRTDRST